MDMGNELLAAGGWVLDVVFFLILIGGIAYGVYKGIIGCVCKLAGTFFAIVFAVMFCVSFAAFLEKAFGMTTAISNGLAGSFAGKEGYDVGLSADVAGAEISAALKEIGIGSFTRLLVGFAYKNVETIPAGTTTALLIGSALAKWIAIAIAFVLLIVLIKVGAILLDKGFSSIADKVASFRIINQALGGLFGLFEAALLLFFALAVCSWLPIAGLHDFISSSTVVGAIFRSGWFESATSYAVSGQWFSDYIAVGQ